MGLVYPSVNEVSLGFGFEVWGGGVRGGVLRQGFGIALHPS